MKLITLTGLLMAMGWCGAAQAADKLPAAAPDGPGGVATNIHGFTARDIDGQEIALSAFKGKVLLIVNVASKCGLTGQYAGLEKLYQARREQGFAILGFPANDFGRQEPGNDEEIKRFCTLTYGVTFPMFAKITVKGADIHPLYAFLTSKAIHPEFGGPITWNFNKFLVGRNGAIRARFGSRTKPDDQDLIAAIEQALAAKGE